MTSRITVPQERESYGGYLHYNRGGLVRAVRLSRPVARSKTPIPSIHKEHSRKEGSSFELLVSFTDDIYLLRSSRFTCRVEC